VRSGRPAISLILPIFRDPQKKANKKLAYPLQYAILVTDHMILFFNQLSYF
jgi:hypothetical protein